MVKINKRKIENEDDDNDNENIETPENRLNRGQSLPSPM